MPKNWKIYKLEELTTKLGDGLHGTPKYSLDGEYYFINGNNLTNGKIEIKENTKRVDKAQYLKYQKPLNDRTIFVSINGTLGNVATYNNEKVVLGKSACYFNINDNVDKVFIKQFVSSPDFKYFLECNATGSVIKNISLKSMREYEIQLPPLPEQTQIAKILSAIDDKIENNLAINKTLEDMAMALYKHWFVDFGPFQEGEFIDSELGLIPKGWEVRRLEEIIEIKRGGSPRPIKDFIADEGLHWLKISDATASNSPFLYTTKEYIKIEGLRKTILIKPNSIILSNSATPGLPRLIEFHTCIHDGWLHFPKINRFNRYILYLLFLDIKEHLIQQGNGSVFTNLKTDILKSQLIKLPPIELEQTFTNQITPWFEKIKSNTKENHTLTKLRDTLLPKLVSGEVRLKEFREGIDAEINSA
jgi:type I restriction enzyme S subunit